MAWSIFVVFILGLPLGYMLVTFLRHRLQRRLILRHLLEYGPTSVSTLTTPQGLNSRMRVEDILFCISELKKRGCIARKDYYADDGGRQEVFQITEAGRRQIGS